MLLLAGACNVGKSYADASADSNLVGFPGYLLSEGEYFRAATEFMRVLYEAKMVHDTITVAAAMEGISRANEIGADAPAAAEWLWRNRADIPCGDSGEALRTRLLRLLLESNRPGDVIRLTSRLDLSFGCYNGDDIGHLCAGIAYVQSETFDRAKREFLGVPDGSPVKPVARDYAEKLDGANDIPRKSAKAALALSVVPGLGYVYAGYTQTGIATFIVNGLLFVASYEAFRSDQTALGILSGLFGVTWYIGGAVGAARTAEQFNEQSRGKYVEEFKFPEIDEP